MSGKRDLQVKVDQRGRSVIITVPFDTHYQAIEFYEHCTAEPLARALNQIGTVEAFSEPTKRGR